MALFWLCFWDSREETGRVSCCSNTGCLLSLLSKTHLNQQLSVILPQEEASLFAWKLLLSPCNTSLWNVLKEVCRMVFIWLCYSFFHVTWHFKEQTKVAREINWLSNSHASNFRLTPNLRIKLSPALHFVSFQKPFFFTTGKNAPSQLQCQL